MLVLKVISLGQFRRRHRGVGRVDTPAVRTIQSFRVLPKETLETNEPRQALALRGSGSANLSFSSIACARDSRSLRKLGKVEALSSKLERKAFEPNKSEARPSACISDVAELLRSLRRRAPGTCVLPNRAQDVSFLLKGLGNGL